ncbi:MAG: precorrin-8X methylmutase [Syntrophales bacterium]|nr:precorrin-8X methylmutase [Syntrophales bacterium]MDD5233882.1 precorrin-8X methylmutase [Syntrophales bacterium]
MKRKKSGRAFIHSFHADPKTGREIEELSFGTIDREAPAHRFHPGEWEVVRRMIHAAGDFGIMENIRFSAEAIASGMEGLREGRCIYADSNMIRAGLSLDRLRSVCPVYSPANIFCHVADPEVAEQAEAAGLPRSLFAVRKAKTVLDGGIAVFGNAPVALLELNRMIMEEGIRPALVIAMPVGFVHVVESKEEILSLPVPSITLAGRRGGSTLAVSAVHALCTLAISGRS